VTSLRLDWRRVWDSYRGRVVCGSIGLFLVLPVVVGLVWTALARNWKFPEGYGLGIYIGTGIAVLWYTVETYYLRLETARSVKNAWTANQAGLLKQILEEYAALTKDVESVREWWQQSPKTAIARYEEQLQRDAKKLGVSTDYIEKREARRKVSQYFLRLRALCEKEMIDPSLVAETLGDEPVQMFLLYIDPLDEAVRKVAGKTHKVAEREYFQSYLQRSFPQTAQQDPWGLRYPSG